jgi:hypothetical protein
LPRPADPVPWEMPIEYNLLWVSFRWVKSFELQSEIIRTMMRMTGRDPNRYVHGTIQWLWIASFSLTDT